MAMQRRIAQKHRDVFPAGAYLVGEVEPVADFNAATRADGSRPQATDAETGYPVWSVPVLDADPEAGKRDKTVTVKVASPVRPVPPENTSGTPFTLVEFSGITATAWVDDNGPRARLAWSLRASGFAEKQPSARDNSSGQLSQSGQSGKAAEGKAVA